MVLMVVCGALLLAGVVLTLAWSGERLLAPLDAPTQPAGGATAVRPRREALRLYAWWASMVVLLGAVTGVLVTGAGGRLAMRLLAATSPDATGRVTEAQVVVGRISPDGTLAYLLFGALPLAFASAALYLLVAPWLPRGRAAGPTFGVLLLVAVAPFVDPLRAANIDFDLVGPGWLSVLVFAALSLLQGAALAAIGGRLSRSLPLLSPQREAALGAPLLIAVVYVPVGVVLAVGAMVVAAAPRLLPWVLAAGASPTGVVVGRVVLAVAVLAALPSFIAAIVSITTSVVR